MNSIIICNDKHINDNPQSTHEGYNNVNNGIITAFVSMMGCFQRMSKEEDDVWRTLVAALAKGNKPLNLSFRFNEDGWSGMTAERATELI